MAASPEVKSKSERTVPTEYVKIQHVEERKLLRNLPADEYVSMMDRFRGPEVTIFIGKERKRYDLPKNLVCYYSSYFNSAFNGGFKETVEQEIRIQDCAPHIFDMIIQWMYTGKIIVPRPRQIGNHKMIDYLDFLVCADAIDLLGPFDEIIAEVKKILVSKDAPSNKHIRQVAQLPVSHPIRKLFAEACVKSYWEFLQQDTRSFVASSPKKSFEYQKELDEVDAFAADLLRAFTKTYQSRPRNSNNNAITDPLTGMVI